MNKKDIRKKILKKINDLSKEDKVARDEIIFSKVIESSQYKKCKNLFVFVSYNNEVDTHKIIKHALQHGKKVSVPVILSMQEGMVAVLIDNFGQLEKNKYGILEPPLIETNIVAPQEIDLVLVPGVAFDEKGGRIGYGAGMYDRYLVHLRNNTPKIALAYKFQLLSEVPMEPFDVRLDGIITD
ncbi:MAG: 5-formyltetrahydrofolate cyclo-ligase [Clostridiales bacterium]|uniref:5-formyltetrahydrofolate cyclo-ligase n=1 Tax=Clostridium sp. N3C TaxID=1776758 RepID=UPI00092DFDE1|nr:5-formyltetrahydrofolate cyclo-ligase [Clostridium sp. N3C]NLZ49118.1 5-formyltetrahydrofolate cyclo-ligase [Clostridiales bacterium]SCN21679.1 putative 5-formyltetrahydrofolate cyclo-ligase [Clostridium sp. N3C]